MKGDFQLDKLIRYNINRDEELESIIAAAFIDNLDTNDWMVDKIDATDIYFPNGTILIEWDGYIYATHKDIPLPVLFILETKQVMDKKNFGVFKKWIAGMGNILKRLNPKLLPVPSSE